jgi:magnesium and cobalt transporter
MSELPVGQAAIGPRSPDDEDPDSNGRASFFSRLFRRDVSDSADDATGDAGRSGGMASRELRVNLRKLRHMRVDDVSVPRADIVAVPADADLDEVVEVLRSSELSRLPVYSETLDQPLGLVLLKDLALGYGFGDPKGDFALNTLLRPLLYAPPSMPIGVLLQKMQAAHIHMALVIDEYGGVDGLVTIEDLLEQIVGDISDEHDEAESALWTAEGPGVFLAEGRMDLEDFEAAIGTTLGDAELAEEVDTLGGLVFRLAGRVPVRGEVVAHPAGHEFEVIDADARKVQRLRVRLRRAEDGFVEAAE